MDDKTKKYLEDKWPNISFEPEAFRRLIISTDEYIVYIDNDLDVDWETTDEYDEKGYSDAAKHNEVVNFVAELECIPNDHHSANIRLDFKRMCGEALARSLGNDYVNAKIIAEKALNYIAERNEEQSRYWYLKASVISGIACIILFLICWFWRIEITSYWGETARFCILASLAGGIGAMLSIILRIGNSKLSSAAGEIIHYWEGCSRILAGCLLGFAVSLVLKAGLVLPHVMSSEYQNASMLAFGFISGISERFVPSIISQVIEKSFADKSFQSVEG